MIAATPSGYYLRITKEGFEAHKLLPNLDIQGELLAAGDSVEDMLEIFEQIVKAGTGFNVKISMEMI